jgi:hypothetical protein
MAGSSLCGGHLEGPVERVERIAWWWLRGLRARRGLKVLRATLARLGLVEEMGMLFACPELLQRVSQRTGLSELRRGGLQFPHRQRRGGRCILVRRLRCRRFSFSHHTAVGA